MNIQGPSKRSGSSERGSLELGQGLGSTILRKCPTVPFGSTVQYLGPTLLDCHTDTWHTSSFHFWKKPYPWRLVVRIDNFWVQLNIKVCLLTFLTVVRKPGFPTLWIVNCELLWIVNITDLIRAITRRTARSKNAQMEPKTAYRSSPANTENINQQNSVCNTVVHWKGGGDRGGEREGDVDEVPLWGMRGEGWGSYVHVYTGRSLWMSYLSDVG